MAICCFSLTGIPLTVGFLGKLLIIKPALAAVQVTNTPGGQAVHTAMTWLVVIVMINAAISAAHHPLHPPPSSSPAAPTRAITPTSPTSATGRGPSPRRVASRASSARCSSA